MAEAQAELRDETAEERETEEAIEAEEAVADEIAGGPSPPPEFFTGGHSIGARFAGRIGRHAAAYGAGSFSQAGSALVSRRRLHPLPGSERIRQDGGAHRRSRRSSRW